MKNLTLSAFLLAFFLSVSCFAQTARSAGKDYAVFFYVTEFKTGFNKLPATEQEAKTLEQELRQGYGFVTELVANPTKQQIREKIRKYSKDRTADDQVLFFFSMHGIYNSESDRGYLIPKDGAYSDTYGDSWYSYDDLRSDLAPSKARHILVALDACYSGSFGSTLNRGEPGALPYDQVSCDMIRAQVMQKKARQFCSSGNKKSKTPAESKFANHFLNALKNGEDDNQPVRFKDLIYELEKIDAPKPEGGSFGMETLEGEFVFIPKTFCSSTKQIENKESNAEGNRRAEMKRDSTSWAKASEVDKISGYQAYLVQYPNGLWRTEAETRLKKLEDDQLWTESSTQNTIVSYQEYIAKSTTGTNKLEAEKRIQKFIQVNYFDRHEVYAGLGFFSGDYNGARDEGYGTGSILGNNIDYETSSLNDRIVKTSHVLALGYNWNYKPKRSVGLFTSYENIDVLSANRQVVSNKVFSAIAMYNFWWYKPRRVNIYSAVGVGYGVNKIYNYETGSRTSDRSILFHFSPVCIRFNGKINVFTEIPIFSGYGLIFLAASYRI